MNRKERTELAEWAAVHALKCGADQSDAVVSTGRETEIEVRGGKTDKLAESTRQMLGLTLYVKGRYSSQSTNDLRKRELMAFIREAVASTSVLSPDPHRMLPDPRFYPKGDPPKLMLRDPKFETVDPAARIRLASAAEDAAMSRSSRIISTTASYSDSCWETSRCHSTGFSGEREATDFWISAEVTLEDPAGGRPEDWASAGSRFYAELPSPESVGIEAAQRALAKLGQKKIDTGKFVMIVENRAVRRLVSVLTQSMTAQSINQKSSFLDGMIGKPVASGLLTMTDDPFVPKGFGSRWFDGEGLAAAKRAVIEAGVLKGYYIDTYYGRKMGWNPNSGSVSNLVFKTGEKPLDGMIRSVSKGILVNGFIGGNSNSTTGDFSFGIMGGLIENGSVTRAVNEMNITGNAKTLWANLSEIGSDPYPYSAWRTPSMRFEDVRFSGL
ncbi:TldD/PmbA family protein [bacterium]|nr:TldD/PmbA family protein [bacterium]